MRSYIEKQFATYESSLKLKELGFDEECLGRYTDHVLYLLKEPIDSQLKVDYIFNNSILAPLYQQIFDWFEEKHSIRVKSVNKFSYEIVNIASVNGFTDIYTSKEYCTRSLIRLIGGEIK